MATPNELKTIDSIWEKLVQLVGFRPQPPFSVLLTQPVGTTEGLTLYVATTGNDSNAGTDPSAPLRTVQAAVDKLPKQISHSVKISIGAGNFQGAFVSGFKIDADPLARSGAAPYLWIEGTMAPVAPATGPGSGTVTGFTSNSGSTQAVLTDSTQSWTVNDLRGKYCQITGGTGFPATVSTPPFYIIVSNTATTLTLLGTGALAAAASTYQIVDCATFFTSAAATPASSTTTPSQLSLPAASCLTFFNNIGVGLAISKLGFTLGSTNTRGVVTSDSRFRAFVCKLNASTGTLSGFLGQAGIAQGALNIQQIYASGFPTAISAVAYQTAGGSTTVQGVSVNSCFFNGGGPGVISSSPQGIAAFNSQFTGCATGGIVMLSSVAGTQISGCRFDGCATGITTSVGVSQGHNSTSVGLQACDISNSTGAAINLTNCNQTAWLGTMTGTGNLVGLSLAKGARIQIDAASTLTGTTEISLDGVSQTLAAMRAASPKLLTNTYGTIVYE